MNRLTGDKNVVDLPTHLNSLSRKLFHQAKIHRISRQKVTEQIPTTYYALPQMIRSTITRCKYCITDNEGVTNAF